MIEFIYNPFRDKVAQNFKVHHKAGFMVWCAFNRNKQFVVVTMPVWIAALAKNV